MCSVFIRLRRFKIPGSVLGCIVVEETLEDVFELVVDSDAVVVGNLDGVVVPPERSALLGTVEQFPTLKFRSSIAMSPIKLFPQTPSINTLTNEQRFI